MALKTRSVRNKQPAEYKNKAGSAFRKGDCVRLTYGAFTTRDPAPPTYAGKRIMRAIIVSLFSDVKGLVLVEPKLGGYHTWDVDDLEHVTPTKQLKNYLKDK